MSAEKLRCSRLELEYSKASVNNTSCARLEGLRDLVFAVSARCGSTMQNLLKLYWLSGVRNP